jgi:glycosyltransferase involved in cell wall biosynthesis
MAARKAVISTTLGAEGLPVEPGVHLVLADSAAGWVKAILDLLDNPERRGRLGAAARQFADRYDWRRIVPDVDGFIDKVLKWE